MTTGRQRRRPAGEQRPQRQGSAGGAERGGAERGGRRSPPGAAPPPPPPPWSASWTSPTAARAASGSYVFRLGNTVHALVAARRTTQLPDVVPRVCLTASNLTRALYFVCDTVLWLKSVGLQPDIDAPKWRNWATKCYYFSLLMNLARDWYEVSWRLEQAVQEEKIKENSSWDKRNQELNCLKCDGLHGFFLLLFQILKNHPPLVLDMVKNLCDLSGPLDTLGIYKTNPGVIGFCGLLSSLVGILTLASPHLKLKQ
ncbi:peroxisomal membrane protein 11A isoform X2 [Cygnus olor]|uniref:peroxisomal membrane protein 11A isoform X2 n=1 Tax=Cygnus olor TaxID=8869 RepID=UPI001ADE47E7|nr:peroxisomal membrane protein 11A isoform X2 [Cygnus olor]